MIDFIDKTSEQSGTPINRKNLMGIQGFNSKTITTNDDGSITETDTETGHTMTIVVQPNGNIVQSFVGEKTITKTVSISQNMLQEVVM